MKIRFVRSTCTWVRAQPLMRPTQGNMCAPIWPRRSRCAAWPISIPISKRSSTMRSVKTHLGKQAGIALITTLLLLMLMSAMVVGFILLVTEGQRLSGMNNDQSRSFYGAEAGMEKLTADLGALFGNTYAPSGTQVDALTMNPPVLPATQPVQFVDALGNNSYAITYPKDGNGNPKASF